MGWGVGRGVGKGVRRDVGRSVGCVEMGVVCGEGCVGCGLWIGVCREVFGVWSVVCGEWCVGRGVLEEVCV